MASPVAESKALHLPLAMVEPVDASENTDPAEQELRLSALHVVEQGQLVRLRLDFSGLPQYRLLQNGHGAAPLVVSFKDAGLRPEFSVPAINSPAVERISLLPQQGDLQLLVDLTDAAQVSSVEMVESDDSVYQLWIDLSITPSSVKVKEPPVKDANVKPVPVQTQPSAGTVASTSVTRRKPTLSLDQKSYLAGMRAVKERDLGLAIKKFEQALSRNPKRRDARLQLTTLLIRTQQVDQAERVLSTGLQLEPADSVLRKQYARLLYERGRYGDAVTLLQRNPVPGLSKDIEYYALLAALLRENQQYHGAAQIYERLLKVRPRHSLWWMGLAIARDQDNQSDAARSAYQQALKLPGLEPDLQKYIHTRLEQL